MPPPLPPDASPPPAPPASAGRRRELPWARLADEQLLDVRMCDLGVTLERPSIQHGITQVGEELAARGIRFRPHYWVSDDFFTPDGVPGIAIPFYLAHPRLERLERNRHFEVEGGTPSWFRRILRHEVGHAIDNAYDLRQRADRQKLFGPSSAPYPEHYSPRPYSRSFVLHLDSWYAQSHPDEDFAETFAVWMHPRHDWRRRYADWPALRKLEYMDRLMREIAAQDPPVRTRRVVWPLHRIRRTLRQHYVRKAKHYGLDYPNFYDQDLRRLFSDAPEHAHAIPASRFLARIRRDVRRIVADWTGVYQYTIDQVLQEMSDRCDELNLRLASPEETAKADFMVVLTMHTMNYLHSGRHMVAL
jgi:hypothetical protein